MRPARHVDTWLCILPVIDLKNKPGGLQQGEGKADVTITIDDQDYVDLVSGKLNGQQVMWCCFVAFNEPIKM